MSDRGTRVLAGAARGVSAFAGWRPLGQDLVGWALAAALGYYIWYATRLWNVPDRDAVPFGPLWIAGTSAALALWLATGRRLTPLATIALGSVVAMLLTDVSYGATQALRDLHLYVRAGEHFLTGQPVYLLGLFTERPTDLANYPFLYPPLTLPVFAALARMPAQLSDAGWLLGSLAAVLATLRLFGFPWRWCLLLLAWPPIFQGLQVGNVAVLLGLLFALGPRLGAGLVVGGVFKIYSAIAALWLVREGRWTQLALGVAIVAVTAALTLPLVGIALWPAWLRGLELFRQSQPILADYLYGFGLWRYAPPAVAFVVAAVVVVAALMARGREGLARLGLATAIASPSLYSHGLIVGLPAFLLLRARWLWTVLAITSVAPGIAWWLAIGLAVAGWWLRALRRDALVAGTARAREAVDPDELVFHPLPLGSGPWPAAGPGQPAGGNVSTTKYPVQSSRTSWTAYVKR